MDEEEKRVETEREPELKSDPFVWVRKALDEEKIDEAGHLLDAFKERNAEWHYLRSGFFRKKKWYLESKRELKKAIALDGDNVKYKEAMEALAAIPKEEQKRRKEKSRAGKGAAATGWSDACGEGGAECCCACCLEGICTGICEGCG